MVTLSQISHKMCFKVFQAVGCDPLIGWKSFQWVITNTSNYNDDDDGIVYNSIYIGIVYNQNMLCVAVGRFDSVTYVSTEW